MDNQTFNAMVASFMCHAFSTPIGNISNALDMVDDEDEDMRAFARRSLSSSADKTRALLEAYRYAFGVPGTEEGEMAQDAVAAFVTNLASSQNFKCEVAVDPETTPLSIVRIWVALGLVGSGLLSKRTEGTAQLSVVDGEAHLRFEVAGAAARLRDALEAALAGREPPGGWSSKEIHAFHLRRLVDQAGGAMTAEAGDVRVALIVRLRVP